MNREVLLPSSLVSLPGTRKEFSSILAALKERDHGLLKVDLDGAAVRDDGFSVSQDVPLYGAGMERLANALCLQRQLRVLRYVLLNASRLSL